MAGRSVQRLNRRGRVVVTCWPQTGVAHAETISKTPTTSPVPGTRLFGSLLEGGVKTGSERCDSLVIVGKHSRIDEDSKPRHGVDPA
jgi:hypothetical protein